MPVRAYTHLPADKKAAAFGRKVISMQHTVPTEGSKTQKRKANKAAHMKNNTAGMR
jgi:hypothetical protein